MFHAIGKYFKGVAYEFTKIRWSKPRKVVKDTIVVIEYIAIFGVIFWALNWMIIHMFKAIGL